MTLVVLLVAQAHLVRQAVLVHPARQVAPEAVVHRFAHQDVLLVARLIALLRVAQVSLFSVI